MRLLLGIKEDDLLVVEVSGSAILLKPKGASVRDTWGLIHVSNVEVKEVEESSPRIGALNVNRRGELTYNSLDHQ